jgi:hypothetical protein
MNRTILRILRRAAAIVPLAAGAALAQVAPTAPPAAPRIDATATYSAFQAIANLNIFNSARVGWVAEGAQPHVDTISLVGTMESDQGRLVFFDSNDPAFRTALREGEKIAEFTVTRIDPAGIRLSRDSKQYSMAMGQQLRRPPGGDWELGAAPPGQGAAAASLEPNSAEPSNAVLLKMLQRRQQSLKQ